MRRLARLAPLGAVPLAAAAPPPAHAAALGRSRAPVAEKVFSLAYLPAWGERLAA